MRLRKNSKSLMGVLKRYLLSAVAVVLVPAAFAADSYVDAVYGSDDYDGTSPTNILGTLQGPKLTLAAAMQGRSDGDLVLAAEGAYTNGNSGAYRVQVPAGVTLKASGLRENTFIVGEAGSGVATEEEPWGCGNGARQCVLLNERAKLIGFTVCGGRGSGWADNVYGAGVSGMAQNGDNASLVVDCVVSNCVSGRGAGVRGATAVRCRFFGNRVKKMGSHIWNVDAYNCYFSDSLSGSQYDAASTRLFNCHLAGSANGSVVFSSYVETDRGGNEFHHSIWSSPNSLASGSTKDDATVRSWNVGLDVNFRPVKGSHYGIDKGSLADCEGLSPAVNMDYMTTDYAGGQRVYNGTIDIGCGEYDVRGDVATTIADSSCFSVTELPTGAQISGSSLSLPSGSEMIASWAEDDADSRDHTYAFTVTPASGATVNVYLGDSAEPAWTVESERTISHSAVGGAEYRIEVVGGSATLSNAIRGNDFYVDASAEDDLCDGTSPVRGAGTVGPKKTLQSAVALVAADHYDVIHVAEGVYDSGTSGIYRFYLNKTGVTVKASGDRKKTFITGQADDSGTYGCGNAAMACVYLGANSRLEGFTVCGGRGPGFTSSNYGAGVRGADTTSLVVDCIVSNCVSGRGAGVLACTAIRCEFTKNRVNTTGTDLMNGIGYNCYFHDTLSYSKYDVYQSTLYNCTTDANGTIRSSKVYNSRIGGDSGLNEFYRCASRTQSSSSTDASTFSDGCYVSTSFNYDSKIRPNSSTAEDVDSGNPAYYDSPSETVRKCLSTDYAGGQRIYNGTIDIGCGEYDWRECFSAQFGRGGKIEVVEAGPNVKSHTERSLTLGVGDELLLNWTLPANTETVRTFSVDGAATVEVDGVAVSVEAGVCSFTAAGGLHTVRIVQTGGNPVTVSDFRTNVGMSIIFR